jgi:hypothetical protein
LIEEAVLVPKRSVVALGASGSGKTVFLASMASKLAVQSRDIGFFLSVPLAERRLLAQKFEEVAYELEWPPGTREVSEWHFTCSVFALNSETFPTFEFTYVDYAGGLLTDVVEDNERAKELEDRADSADALLAIIDGHKLYAEMDSSIVAPPGTSLWRDLSNFISTMAQQGSTPIHFIISKWDLLHEKYSLREVRERLMEFESFANLVQGRGDRNTPIRLIPVSSVGMDFAELQDGTMRKIPNAVPKPFQVEMPISHVVLDEMKAHIRELKRKEAELKEEGTENPPESGLFAALRRLLEQMRRKKVLGNYEFIGDILSEVVEYLESWQHEVSVRNMEQLQRDRDEALRQVKDEQTAMESTMKSFMFLMDKLSRDFPESDLSKQ